jgi:DNA gyrase/topoisomerase IV subunit A
MSKTRSARPENIEDLIQGSENRLADLISSMKVDIQTAMESIKLEMKDLKSQANATEHMVATQANEIQTLRTELVEFKSTFKLFENRVILKDIHDRKTNLLFYGIPEGPQENAEDTLRSYFVNTLKVNPNRVDDIYFKNVHRLPKSEYQRQHKPTAPPCIIATFLQMKDRDMIFNAKRILKGTEQTIQTDLPALMKKRRAILSREAYTIRVQEKIWTRVRVVGTEVVLETRNPEIPLSPWAKRN